MNRREPPSAREQSLAPSAQERAQLTPNTGACTEAEQTSSADNNGKARATKIFTVIGWIPRSLYISTFIVGVLRKLNFNLQMIPALYPILKEQPGFATLQ